jgi:hypothetical protein
MLQLLRDLIDQLDELAKYIGSIKAVHVNSQKDKQLLRDIVDAYFNNVRPSFIGHDFLGDLIVKIDKGMQDLLVLSHKRSMTDVVKKKISFLRRAMIEVDTATLGLSNESSVNTQFDIVDERIIKTLESLTPSAALSYEQALHDLSSSSRKSWRGPATDLREALRETIDYLAPDKDVKAEPSFKQDPNTNGPTMKQKVRFILSKRGVSQTLSSTPERAIDSIEAAIGSFVRSVYTRSNVSTHTPTDKREVLRIRDWVRVVLCELLEIHDGH